MTTFIKKKLKDREGNYLVTPSSADIVYCSDGETVATKLRKVENDEFSPTVTQMSSVSKVGVGEDIDISDNTQEGYLKSAILKGCTGYRDIDTGEILETFEEGRNLELVSVKMPVLCTTGKNLFNTNKQITSNATYEVIGDELILSCSSPGWYNLKLEFFNLTPNKPYTLSYDYEILEGSPNNQVIVVDSSNTTISNNIAPSDGKISMKFYCGNSTKFGKIRYYNIQLEEASAPTSYEPYKSNILTVNEPIELRGIGEVQDTLDLITSEMIENFESFTFNGSEDWRLQDDSLENTTRFILLNYAPNKVNNQKIGIINTYEWGIFDEDKPGIIITKPSGHVYLRTPKMSVDELKTMLSVNPIHGYYNKEKSIKTVDLEPSGTNPTTQPYVWKDGHIQLSSEEGSLLPTLDYSVTTSRGGQILENTKHIAKQDKRIYDLEMLMISSSVEDAYQRLLLQNDVQVMSRMDETHLNPMRYYMLTRLIEEKMYEETDMLNKLDTFFLYGDISSDQYFELMDKIFNLEEEIYEDEEHSEEK